MTVNRRNPLFPPPVLRTYWEYSRWEKVKRFFLFFQRINIFGFHSIVDLVNQSHKLLIHSLETETREPISLTFTTFRVFCKIWGVFGPNIRIFSIFPGNTNRTRGDGVKKCLLYANPPLALIKIPTFADNICKKLFSYVSPLFVQFIMKIPG